jgi:hypothetical protein
MASPSPVCGNRTAQTINKASNPAQTTARLAAALVRRISRSTGGKIATTVELLIWSTGIALPFAIYLLI